MSSNTAGPYSSLVEQDPDWSIQMTARIGERVAWFRDRKIDPNGKRMTVQALADRCAELGLPLGRVTITKLEGGKRQAITPAEVMVIAAALEVSPLELVIPAGYEEPVEVLPGLQLPGLAAARWFAGQRELLWLGESLTVVMPEPERESAVRLLEAHAERIRWWQRFTDESPEIRERTRELTSESLREIRARMRDRGMLLPELPPELGPQEAPEEVVLRPQKWDDWLLRAGDLYRRGRIVVIDLTEMPEDAPDHLLKMAQDLLRELPGMIEITGESAKVFRLRRHGVQGADPAGESIQDDRAGS